MKCVFRTVHYGHEPEDTRNLRSGPLILNSHATSIKRTQQKHANTTDIHLNHMGKTELNYTRYIQNKTHAQVHFHNMGITSIHHKHQQTTDNTEHRRDNLVHTRHLHPTPI